MSHFNLDLTALGGCLTTSQRVGMKNALYKLQINERLDDIKFWGKVYGTQQDYFIAVNTTINTNIAKHFYWRSTQRNPSPQTPHSPFSITSTTLITPPPFLLSLLPALPCFASLFSNDNGVTFARFPALDDFILRVAPLIPGLFTGNPALKSRDPSIPLPLDEDGQPIPDDDEPTDDDGEDKTDPDAPARPPPARKLTEEERLAYIVRTIDHDCAITPVGHSYLTPTGSIHVDPAFPGVPLARLTALASYGYWRDPESNEAKARQRKSAHTNCYQWQDGVVGEWGKGGGEWAVSVEGEGLRVGLRSLKWMGWEVKVEAGAKDFKGGYFGYGEENVDLPFMV